MIQLHIQKREDLNTYISFRAGEQKLGEVITLCDSLELIKESAARFVIFGISESIGVQANFGKKGTHKAWKAFIRSFVNVQSNEFNNAKSILVLGHIAITPDEPITSNTPKELLGSIVSRIDNKVAQVVETIVRAGKIPIIIGGGHNNAYGNIKGTSNAVNKSINVINIDAHTDLRVADYRHSGNGFTYALEKSNGPALKKYAIFGLHKNYTPQYIFDFIDNHSEYIKYKLFEDLKESQDVSKQFANQLGFISSSIFGLELDCDAITNFPSSAQTPSGLDFNKVRELICTAAQMKNCSYFHICEAAPSKKNQGQVGKALSYLVTDFMRSYNENHTLS